MTDRRSNGVLARSETAPLLAVLWNVALAYVLYALARLIFYLLNDDLLAPALTGGVGELLRGAFLFDTSAIAYTNVAYIVLMLLPVPHKERPGYHLALKWLWFVVNLVALVINLADAVYFPFTLRRTTTTVFTEFAREDNLLSIIGVEVLHHWYLVLAVAVIALLMWKLYAQPRLAAYRINPLRYALLNAAALLVAVGLCIAGMRGGFTTAVRPITVSNANQYVSRPMDAALVLNTPFALLRTIGKNVFRVPEYYSDEDALEQVYTPIHVPADSVQLKQRNVVILIVESFGREYIGAYNRHLVDSTYQGYTPFVDSLLERSLTFSRTYCNGRKSIDGMPSILSSIPMMVEPFFLTPASMNHVSGIADLLGREGWQTAFFHGAQNGSMGFQAFARSTGFDAYYGRDEFNADPRTRGDADFDGTWAIWDEPFLQYYCRTMSEMREPFMTAVFTASSHHPFVVPEQYKDSLEGGPLEIHKCIRYTDMALQRFFEAASRQPWYDNTLFVLTSDHTNMSYFPEYQTDLGVFASPIIFFDPSGELFEPGVVDAVAQQIDIMPTIMGLLGYEKPYLAFGIDALHTPAEETWAFSYLNGIYQLVQDDMLLQYDGSEVKGLYDIDDDVLLKHNLADDSEYAEEREQMLHLLQAIIQQYMERMTTDKLLAD